MYTPTAEKKILKISLKTNQPDIYGKKNFEQTHICRTHTTFRFVLKICAKICLRMVAKAQKTRSIMKCVCEIITTKTRCFRCSIVSKFLWCLYGYACVCVN